MPTTNRNLIDVAIDARSGGSEAVYTYAASTGSKLGDAVIVPLGNRQALGYIVNRWEGSEQDLGFSFAQLREVQQNIEGFGLPEALIELLHFVSEEYLCPLSVSLASAAPPGIMEKLVTSWQLANPPEEQLSTLQSEVLRTIASEGGVLKQKKGKKLDPSIIKVLKLLKTKGIVSQMLSLDQASERKSGGTKLYRLTANSESIEGFLAKEGRRKPAQALVLIQLQLAERFAYNAQEIKAMCGVTDQTLKALVETGLLEQFDQKALERSVPPVPNRYQRLAIDALELAINEHRSTGSLLYGVTGSGKTEVFLNAAAAALKAGRQILYLVPEIALATQAVGQLRARFGTGIALVHSEMPTGERLRTFQAIRSGEMPIVLGARSAVFAPFNNLGFIVMDEEHETGYKQDSAPRYHTKALVKKLSQIHSCPYVLASATPSVESFIEAEQEQLSLLSLPERAIPTAQLPLVDIEDLREGYLKGHPAMISPNLADRIEKTLAKGEQVILFLNRRAYGKYILCRECGHREMCPNCSVALAFHQGERRLRCHHCGFQKSPPQVCPKCSSTRLSPLGVRTEKVEEAVRGIFPEAKIARLDRDITRRKGALEEILAKFRSGEIQILVGTQMVAKGLDFPNVTLVGVILADTSLNRPDFRATERTFQLLSQVAGRSGRGTSPGQVLIQTFNPEVPAILLAQKHNFLTFFEETRDERKAVGYPPFCRLVNIVFAGENQAEVIRAADDAVKKLKEFGDLDIRGPVDCPLAKLKTRWRWHALVRLRNDQSPSLVGEALLGFKPAGIQVMIDVDPFNLM